VVAKAVVRGAVNGAVKLGKQEAAAGLAQPQGGSKSTGLVVTVVRPNAAVVFFFAAE